MAKIVDLSLTSLVAFVMIGGGAAHLAVPQDFAPLVPPILPTIPVLYATGMLQIAIGLAALWPCTRGLAGLTFAALCALYLPLHLWDYFRPDPVFTPPVAATVRVLVQTFFIWTGIAIWRRNQAQRARLL